MAFLGASSGRERERESDPTRHSRRGFLRTVGGATAGTALFVSGCDSGGGVGGNESPSASFSTSAAEGNALKITFDAGASEDPDGSIAEYNWDFGGDGTRAENEEEEAPVATYTYDRPGVYTVRLVVADRRGGVARATKEVTVGSVDPGDGPVPINLNNDIGVLNYAYALEQLEAAFYARVLEEGTFSGSQEAVISDIAAHEDIHRLSLQTLLQTAAIRDLTPSFGGINFGSPADVLETAQTFEGLGVSAYNGAADLLSSEAFLGAAGSIVSVEARHAAAIRDLTDPMDHFFSGEFPIGGSFAIDDNGLYEARDPQEVLGVATSFVEERFDVQGG